MNREERSSLVARLLASAQTQSGKEVEIIKESKERSKDFLYIHLKRYVLSKFLLPADCKEDNIKMLARLSLARMMKLDVKMIRELDKATPCDRASSESTKKVLLLYSVQRDLGLPDNAGRIAKVKTMQELAAYVFENM